MAIVSAVNVTLPNAIAWATAGTDRFVRQTHLAGVTEDFDLHDHAAGKGLGVKRLQTAVVPAASGEVRVNADALQWWGATAGAVRTAVDLEGTQTVTGAKTFSSVANFSNGLTVAAGGIAVVGNSTITGTINSQTISAAASFTGTVTVATGLTVTAGNVTLLAGDVAASNASPTLSATATTGTNRAVARFTNTGGNGYVGMDSSTGSFFGASNYSMNVMAPTGAALELSPNGIATNRVTIATTGAVTIRAATTIQTGGLAVTGASTFSATVYLGAASNANMTQGLTINQGGADDEILSLKSSDVAHGVTTVTETTTYLSVLKAHVTLGGALVRGVAGGAGTEGLSIFACAGAANTAKSTAGTAPVRLDAAKTNVAAVQSVGASGNLAVIGDNAATRFIFQQDGSAYEDVGTAFVNYDAHDDVALLTDLSRSVACAADPIHAAFRDWAEPNRDQLEALDLVRFNPDGHHFANRSKIQMLLVGAIRQQAARIAALETRLALASG